MGSQRSLGMNWKLIFLSLLLATMEPEGVEAEVIGAETGRSDEQILLAMNMEGEDQEALLELLEVLEEETEIATKTKMNSDYVPGLVTVLHGEHLETLGIRTVAEAMSLVPGVQLTRLATGEPSIKVRGISFPFNAGNIKVMLNSIALSRESSGINSSVLLMPVEQVDRIEIIRGPGSSVYGDFAMAGVVNIITRNADGRLFLRGGDDESVGGGGHYFYRNDEQDLSLGLNISLIDDGESSAKAGINPDEERHVGVFTLDYHNFSLTLEGVRRNLDYDKLDTPAQPGPSPPPDAPAVSSGPVRDSQDEKTWVIEGRQKIELGQAGLEGHLLYLHNEGQMATPPREFRGDRIETGLDLSFTPFAGHQLILGLSYTDSDIDYASDAGRPGGLGAYEVEGTNRKSYSTGIQDVIAVSDHFSLTLALRFDDYDDVGDLLTPRIAGVYRLGEHHVLKAQFSEGFRAPTFWEIYPRDGLKEDLDFEVIDTTELTYIYRRSQVVGRVTLYFSEIDNGLYSRLGERFGNFAVIESKGVEVEWEQRIGDNFRWLANISYVDTWDDRWELYQTDDYQSPGVAEWLGNLAFFLQPFPNYMLTGRWLYVGDRAARDGDIKGYDSVDFTASRSDLFLKGLTLRLSAKNIFDETISYTTQRPHGLSIDEFEGRSWWLTLTYDF